MTTETHEELQTLQDVFRGWWADMVATRSCSPIVRLRFELLLSSVDSSDSRSVDERVVWSSVDDHVALDGVSIGPAGVHDGEPAKSGGVLMSGI